MVERVTHHIMDSRRVHQVFYCETRCLESKPTKLNRDSLGADYLIQALRWDWRSAWMGKPYSDDLRDRVVAAMASGRSCRDVGLAFAVAPSTAGNWFRRYQQTQSHAARPVGGAGQGSGDAKHRWKAERRGRSALEADGAGGVNRRAAGAGVRADAGRSAGRTSRTRHLRQLCKRLADGQAAGAAAQKKGPTYVCVPAPLKAHCTSA